MKKVIVWTIVVFLTVFITAVVGGSFFMLDYSLAPDPNRMDTDSSYQQLFKKYPECVTWVDSLQRNDALRDTFMTMPSGERHHAYYVYHGGNKTALIIHGWRNNAVKFFYLACMYERELGYNVVMPDLHAHGLSEGKAVQMGWLDRLDVMQWLQAFKTDTMVVHGVSMGAATTMMLSGEKIPVEVKDIHFVEDCGYTSVWDEFSGQLKEQFDLPEFPLLYTSSLLCRLINGWSFGEASPLNQVKKCRYPMFFIHGDSDTFVPTEMVYQLYDAKPSNKEIWIAKGAEHALSYFTHREEYVSRIKQFIE